VTEGKGAFPRSGAFLRRRRDQLRHLVADPDYPVTAIEVRPGFLGVVRLVRERRGWAIGGASSVQLEPGVLRVSMSEPNILDGQGFESALKDALERAGALTAGRVGLVLPDPIARMALLSRSGLKTRRVSEAEEMIRFRLLRAVPFDVRQSQLAFVSQGSRGADDNILAVIISKPILQGYESALHSVGLRPTVVELSGLAILDTLGPRDGDHLLVNWDDGYLSLLLSRSGWPILARTVAAPSVNHVVQEIAHTVLYYRDRLGGIGLAGATLRSAVLDPEDAVRVLEEPLGVRPQALPPLGDPSDNHPTHALAGAAACLRGRAA